MKIIYTFLLLLLIHSNTQAQLSQDEKRVIDYIKAHFGESEELLIESVNINSGTLNT